jgi:hypothetical protein
MYFNITLLLGIAVFLQRNTALGAEDTVTDRQLDRQYLNCNVTLWNISASWLAENIRKNDYNFVHLNLVFNKVNHTSLVLNHTDRVIEPAKWIWTYKSSRVPFAYLSWPSDFGPLSMGLLDAHTFHGDLFFNVTPSDCPLTLGSQYTDLLIAQAIKDKLRVYLTPEKEEYDILLPSIADYKHDYLCYLQTIPNINSTLDYYLALHFGQYLQGVEYKCCHTNKSDYRHPHKVRCSQHAGIPVWHECLAVPFVVGAVLFVFFPFILMKASASLIRTGGALSAKRTARELSGYEEIRPVWDLDLQSRDTDSTEDVSSNPLLFMDGSSPITILSLIAGMCGLAYRYPVAVSRFRRFLFVMLSPCLVYIKLLVYFSYPRMYEQTRAFVDHGIPISFLAILSVYKKSQHLFTPLAGGPEMFICVYLVLGVIILVIPRDMGAILASGIMEHTGNTISPLCLDMVSIRKLSMTNCDGTHGYNRLVTQMQAHLCMIFNPSFWRTALQLQVKRWRLIWGYIGMLCGSGNQLMVCCACALSVPCLILYSMLCALELLACLLYYGAPVVYFLVTVIRGYKNSFRTACGQSSPERRSSWTSVCCTSMRTCLFAAVFLFYIYSYCILFLFSFNYVGITSVFVYLSALVYPGHSVGYVVFGLTLLYYIFSLLTGIGEKYARLLEDTIRVSLELSNPKSDTLQVQGKCLLLPYVDLTGVRRFKVNNIAIKLTQDQLAVIADARGQTNSNAVHYVKYVQNRPGIPRQLFEYIVRRYRPIHIEVSKTMVQILLIGALVFFSGVILSHFSHTNDVSGILHVLALVAVGVLPRVLSSAFSGNKAIEHEDFCRQLKATVRNYWALLEFNFEECCESLLI